MYIADYMTSDPITVGPEMPLPEARELLKRYHFRHLPVVDKEKRLLGIVTDRDLRSAYPSSVAPDNEKQRGYELVQSARVADVMTTECSTLSPTDNLEAALKIFDTEQVGGIPIVDDDSVVIGIFSLLDLVAGLKRLFGFEEKGTLVLAVEDDGTTTILSRLAAALEGAGLTPSRLMRLPDAEGEPRVYIRVKSLRLKDVVKALKSASFQVVEV